MRITVISLQLVLMVCFCDAQSDPPRRRAESEYYVAAYAQHYGVPVELVRAIIRQESNWLPCTVSPKGAVGLMQLMPATAARLGVTDRCNIDQNISGGVRYLAWLMLQFHNDLRLVTAAYYVGEDVIGKRGFHYRNPEVLKYVKSIRTLYVGETAPQERSSQPKRDLR